MAKGLPILLLMAPTARWSLLFSALALACRGGDVAVNRDRAPGGARPVGAATLPSQTAAASSASAESVALTLEGRPAGERVTIEGVVLRHGTGPGPVEVVVKLSGSGEEITAQVSTLPTCPDRVFLGGSVKVYKIYGPTKSSTGGRTYEPRVEGEERALEVTRWWCP